MQQCSVDARGYKCVFVSFVCQSASGHSEGTLCNPNEKPQGLPQDWTRCHYQYNLDWQVFLVRGPTTRDNMNQIIFRVVE